MSVDLYFYEVLYACSKASRSAAEDDGIRRNLDILRRFARSCEANFSARSLLAEAEAQRAWGRSDEAAVAYRHAIRAARRFGETGTEALASELAGRHCLAIGDDVVGPMFLRTAMDIYRRWGAVAVASEFGVDLEIAHTP